MKYLPYFLYLFQALALILLMVLACILSPFLALYSVIARIKVLPGFLQWLSTLDATLDGGIEQNEYPDYHKPLRHPTSKEPHEVIKKWPVLLSIEWIRVWWYRTCWICRNPAQGFSHKLFRIRSVMTEPKFHFKRGFIQYLKEDGTMGEKTLKGITNSYYATSKAITSRTTAPQYFAYKGIRWFNWTKNKIGFRYYFGWKIGRDDQYHILVCAIGFRSNF